MKRHLKNHSGKVDSTSKRLRAQITTAPPQFTLTSQMGIANVTAMAKRKRLGVSRVRGSRMAVSQARPWPTVV